MQLQEESDTERDGFLSYSGERHALIIGLFFGLVSGLTGYYEPMAVIAGVMIGEKKVVRQASEKLVEIKREPWYAGGGAMVGFTVGLAINNFFFA